MKTRGLYEIFFYFIVFFVIEFLSFFLHSCKNNKYLDNAQREVANVIIEKIILRKKNQFQQTTLLQIKYVLFDFFFFRYILSPFGRSLGIKSTRSKKATPNPILETAYNKCSRLHHKAVS